MVKSEFNKLDSGAIAKNAQAFSSLAKRVAASLPQAERQRCLEKLADAQLAAAAGNEAKAAAIIKGITAEIAAFARPGDVNSVFRAALANGVSDPAGLRKFLGGGDR